MESIERDVIRLENPGDYRRKSLPNRGVATLPEPRHCQINFSEVLRRRRSADFFPPITHARLSSFLYDVAYLQESDRQDPNRQKRYVPSMGSLHPAHLLIYRPDEGWFAYLPEVHALGTLDVNTRSALAVANLVREHHPTKTATVLCLLSDCDLAGNYYEHYIPLLIKDAGVLLGHASVVAAAHDLAFRILGRTGTWAVETLIPGLPFKPLATGLALLGDPAPVNFSSEDPQVVE